MTGGLENGFGLILAVFLILLVCVTATVTLRALRKRDRAEAGCSGGRLLEVAWINMPLLIVIALVCCWFIFQPETGFAAAAERQAGGGDAWRLVGGRADFRAGKSADSAGGRQTPISCCPGYSIRQ